MKPRIGVVLGDPCGVGPELAVKLLADPAVRARSEIVAIGDVRIFHMAEEVAGLSVPLEVVNELADDVVFNDERTVFLDVPCPEPARFQPGQVMAEAGRVCLEWLTVALHLAEEGKLDGFCFTPLNKKALNLGGNPYGDEHIFFARELNFDGPFCEHNVLGDLWTTRATSHIPLRDVCENITTDRVLLATRLAHNTLGSAGIEAPCVAVAALNPHAGDGGMFGNEEAEIIAPAVELARAEGIDAHGPFPSDTVFLRARDGDFDAVVTMYHDQGQVAMKLMGFSRGVTVTGGVPIPITTPASGTAFDIVGKGIATVDGCREAFMLVSKMAEIKRQRAAVQG